MGSTTMRCMLLLMMMAACDGATIGVEADASTTTGADAALQSPDPIALTGRGAVYDAVTCAGPDRDEPIVVFLPGTTGQPGDVTAFVGWMGARSGLCVISVRYDNADYVGECCTSVAGNFDAPQDPACLTAQLESRATGSPGTYTCVDGSQHTTPAGLAIEAQIASALDDLDRTLHLNGEVPRWDRIVLSGHSQGALFASYLAIARHELWFAGPIAGGAMPTTGSMPYLPYVTSVPMTPVARHREMHHEDDGDALRRTRHAAMGLPSDQVRSVASDGGRCPQSPHTCVIYDGDLPVDDTAAPVFVDDWLWVLGLR